VVNNNAAAVMLALAALASRRRVIISRSQLVEIGGGFRIPDVLRLSGARLVEVGTTNRVHTADYEEALSEPAALLLRVHHSNYQIIGFVSEPELADLVEIGRRYAVPVMDDLGSGTLLDTAQYGLAHEPTVQESIAAGADVVCFSGDKLLGGPQAGIIVGRADLIARMKKHPFARAVRADKLALSALTATLQHYLKDEAEREIPVWRMIAQKPCRLAGPRQSLAESAVDRRGDRHPIDRRRRQPARSDPAYLRAGPDSPTAQPYAGEAAPAVSAGHRPHRGRPRAARPAHGLTRTGRCFSGRCSQHSVVIFF
jgi:L-seryl-tRNA(Sec) selenium transferase